MMRCDAALPDCESGGDVVWQPDAQLPSDTPLSSSQFVSVKGDMPSNETLELPDVGEMP